jgi:Domain of unknown function (DUF4194)
MATDGGQPSFTDIFGDGLLPAGEVPPAPLDPGVLVQIGASAPLGVVSSPGAGSRFEGDTSELPAEACWALQELVTAPYLKRESKRHWTALMAYRDVLRSRLSELGLLLEVDEDRGFALTRQAADPSPHARILLRARTLTLSASALALWLYNQYLISPGDAVVEEQDMTDHLLGYKPAADTDEARFTAQAKTAIGHLQVAGLLDQVPGTSRYVIAPVITAVLSAERVAALAARYRQLAGADEDPAGTRSSDDTEEDEDA